MPSSTFYVKQSHQGQACLKPSLGFDLRPEDLSAPELLAKEHVFKVWVAYFDALKAASTSGSLNNTVGSPVGIWENVELPMLDGLSKANETFKT